MTVQEIVSLVNGTLLCGNIKEDDVVDYCFASDLMSDVLTVRRSDFLLMTGLANGITGNANLPLNATTALAGQISDQAPLGFDTRATVLPSRGMGGGSMAMGYASGGITININGAGDPQAVAREVERVLNQRDRNLQARNRSRLADID